MMQTDSFPLILSFPSRHLSISQINPPPSPHFPHPSSLSLRSILPLPSSSFLSIDPVCFSLGRSFPDTAELQCRP